MLSDESGGINPEKTWELFQSSFCINYNVRLFVQCSLERWADPATFGTPCDTKSRFLASKIVQETFEKVKGKIIRLSDIDHPNIHHQRHSSPLTKIT